MNGKWKDRFSHHAVLRLGLGLLLVTLIPGLQLVWLTIVIMAIMAVAFLPDWMRKR